MSRLIALVQMLVGLGPDVLKDIPQIIAKVEELFSTTDRRRQLHLVTELLELGAKLTPNEVDDRLVAKLREVLNTPVEDVLVALLERALGNGGAIALSQEQQVEMVKTCQAQGLDLAMIIQIAQLVMSILVQFRNR